MTKEIRKNLITLVAALAMACAATAQSKWSIVPQVGINSTVHSSNFPNWETKRGFVVGATVDYRLFKPLGVSSGLLYAYEGVGMDGEAYCTQRVGFMNIPLLVCVSPVKGLALKGGIQLAVNLHASAEYGKPSWYNPEFTRIVPEITSDLKVNSTYFSIPVGVSYDFWRMRLEFQYQFGLTHLRRIEDLTFSYSFMELHTESYGYRTDLLTVTLGYRFDL